MRRPSSGSLVGLGVVLALIAGATLTSTGRDGPSGVMWCTTCGVSWLTDAFTNVALFVPLGVALVLVGVRGLPAVALSAALSLAIETAQFLGVPSGRTAALNDFLANSIGALVGVLLCQHRANLLRPSSPLARILSVCWTALLLGSLLGASWSMTPRISVFESSEQVTPSRLPNAPGYGWFAGNVDSVRVNETAVPHRGSGPAIAAVARFGSISDSLRADFTVRGRDDRRGVVPMVFVHAIDSRSPALLVGQRGNDAVLRSARRGRSIGLSLPDAVLDNVFAQESPSGRAFAAVVARGELRLRFRVDSIAADSVRFVLTPSLGWTMLQTVVRADSVAAPFLSAIFIGLWFAVGGAWAVAAWQRTGAAVWTIGVLGALWLGTRTLEMPMLAPMHVLLAATAAAVGVVVQRVSFSHRELAT